ncbi:MAG TPA: hypothetical protein VFP55_01385 [Solirubrobacteraceae bacterium]|nr:hypothetical protein [Solirubrobacteraceae bacterium]
MASPGQAGPASAQQAPVSQRRLAGRRWSVRSNPWPLVAVALVVFSYFLLRWARTSPGYDPYGWLVWGYQTLRGTLNLQGAPSWKPVTYFFTVPYSLFGHLAWWLWTVTAVSFALAGPLVAGRIVHRVVLRSTGERWPAIIGAVFTALCVLGIVQYTHYWLSAQSDPMLVTFFLLAIDMSMTGRHRWAFTFLWLVSLGRPEGWPFIGLYFLWAWRAVPRMRAFMIVELILIPFFWFGIPVITGAYWDIAGKLAQHSPRMLHSNKILGTITRFRVLSYSPVEAVAGIGLIIAALRRDWWVLGIAGCCALWMLIEIGFALHGFPGVPRYMFEAGATMIVVSGVGIGWLLVEPARWLALRAARTDAPPPGPASSAAPAPGSPSPSAGPPTPRPPRRSGLALAGRLLGAAAVVGVVALMVPRAVHAAHTERLDLTHERARTAEIHRLDATIKAFGGYKFIRSCGSPASDVEWVSILAWYTKLDVGFVGHRPAYIIHHERFPSILFTALSNGWILHTYHLPANASAACRRLNKAYYIVTPQHPGGFTGHQA